MDQPNYRVVLEGREVGPYDRKTILGMRIKQMLSSDDVLVSSDGTQLTVRELARQQGGQAGAPSNVPAADAAAEPVDSAGAARPMAQQTTFLKRAKGQASPASSAQVLGIAVAGIALVVGMVLLVLLLGRVY